MGKGPHAHTRKHYYVRQQENSMGKNATNPAEKLFGCMWAVLNRRHVSTTADLAIRTTFSNIGAEIGIKINTEGALIEVLRQFMSEGTVHFRGDKLRLIPYLRRLKTVFAEHGLCDTGTKPSAKSATQPHTNDSGGYQHMPSKPNKPGAKPPRFPSSTVEVQTVGKQPKTVEVAKCASTGNRAKDTTPTRLSKEQVGHVSPETVAPRRHDGLPQPTRMVRGRAVWEV